MRGIRKSLICKWQTKDTDWEIATAVSLRQHTFLFHCSSENIGIVTGPRPNRIIDNTKLLPISHTTALNPHPQPISHIPDAPPFLNLFSTRGRWPEIEIIKSTGAHTTRRIIQLDYRYKVVRNLVLIAKSRLLTFLGIERQSNSKHSLQSQSHRTPSCRQEQRLLPIDG